MSGESEHILRAEVRCRVGGSDSWAVCWQFEITVPIESNVFQFFKPTAQVWIYFIP